MRESELLEHIEARSRDLAGRGVVVVGPGDDSAVLRLTGDTLVTVDHLVEGRHFDPSMASVDMIARKAVARSVSDIAAMGGTPVAGLATGCLPEGYREGDALFDRLAHWARYWGCPLVGGDISIFDGPMVLTVTVLGTAHARRGPVLRSGARVGDSVWVSGTIGGSVASGRHLRFEPRVAEGRWLCDALGDSLHAMMDISDGLGRDAGRIGRASGVCLRIEATRIPVGEGARGWRAAAGEGEDYELLFVTDARAAVLERCPVSGVAFTRIGEVAAGSGCMMISPEGESIEAGELGWEHGG